MQVKIGILVSLHLLLLYLDDYNLPHQGREFHLLIRHGDYGSKLVKCLSVD